MLSRRHPQPIASAKLVGLRVARLARATHVKPTNHALRCKHHRHRTLTSSFPLYQCDMTGFVFTLQLSNCKVIISLSVQIIFVRLEHVALLEPHFRFTFSFAFSVYQIVHLCQCMNLISNMTPLIT